MSGDAWHIVVLCHLLCTQNEQSEKNQHWTKFAPRSRILTGWWLVPAPGLEPGTPWCLLRRVFFQLQSGALPTELSEANLPKCHHYLILINNLTIWWSQIIHKIWLPVAVSTLTLTKVEVRLAIQEFEHVNSPIKSTSFVIEQWARLSMVRVASLTRMGEHGE